MGRSRQHSRKDTFNRYHSAWEAKDPDAIVALHSEGST
jgi:hypothetical protein